MPDLIELGEKLMEIKSSTDEAKREVAVIDGKIASKMEQLNTELKEKNITETKARGKLEELLKERDSLKRKLSKGIDRWEGLYA